MLVLSIHGKVWGRGLAVCLWVSKLVPWFESSGSWQYGHVQDWSQLEVHLKAFSMWGRRKNCTLQMCPIDVYGQSKTWSSVRSGTMTCRCNSSIENDYLCTSWKHTWALQTWSTDEVGTGQKDVIRRHIMTICTDRYSRWEWKSTIVCDWSAFMSKQQSKSALTIHQSNNGRRAIIVSHRIHKSTHRQAGEYQFMQVTVQWQICVMTFNVCSYVRSCLTPLLLGIQ